MLDLSFSLFKKRGSEDRKRPSLTNEEKSEASEPDPSNTSNSHTENGERPVDTSIDVRIFLWKYVSVLIQPLPLNVFYGFFFYSCDKLYVSTFFLVSYLFLNATF